MAHFNMQDLHHLEDAPKSPGSLSASLSNMIHNSTACRAVVDSINAETGEYRIVLQGTIENVVAKT